MIPQASDQVLYELEWPCVDFGWPVVLWFRFEHCTLLPLRTSGKGGVNVPLRIYGIIVKTYKINICTTIINSTLTHWWSFFFWPMCLSVTFSSAFLLTVLALLTDLLPLKSTGTQPRGRGGTFLLQPPSLIHILLEDGRSGHRCVSDVITSHLCVTEQLSHQCLEQRLMWELLSRMAATTPESCMQVVISGPAAPHRVILLPTVNLWPCVSGHQVNCRFCASPNHETWAQELEHATLCRSVSLSRGWYYPRAHFKLQHYYFTA